VAEMTLQEPTNHSKMMALFEVKVCNTKILMPDASHAAI
jgi:hypothetical protein